MGLCSIQTALGNNGMWLEATNCAIGVWEKVITEKLAPKQVYVELMVVSNNTIVFYPETSLLKQTMKKMRRKRKHHPSQKGSKQRVMKDLIQQQCMLQNNQKWQMSLFCEPYLLF